MNALQKFTKKFPLAFGLLFALLAFVFFKVVANCFTDSSLWVSVAVEWIAVAFSVIMMLLFAKPTPFYRSLAGFKYGFKKAWYLLLIAFVFMLFLLLANLLPGRNTIDSDFFMTKFLPYLFLAPAIGIFEELICRIGVFGGLLSKMGSSTKGIIWAAIISALIFGFIHTLDAFVSGNEFSILLLGLVVGKTLQVAIVGLLLCAIYLKTRNFFVIAAIHALNDFMLFIFAPSSPSTGSYVDPSQPFNVIAYAFMVVVCIPVIISSIRMLKSVKTPEYGIFVADEYAPRVPEEPKKSKK